MKNEKPIPMIPKLIKFEKEQIQGVYSLHWNFSEFVRDAVDAYIIEQKKLIKLNGG